VGVIEDSRGTDLTRIWKVVRDVDVAVDRRERRVLCSVILWGRGRGPADRSIAANDVCRRAGKRPLDPTARSISLRQGP
jgi:hypothetical protein